MILPGVVPFKREVRFHGSQKGGLAGMRSFEGLKALKRKNFLTAKIAKLLRAKGAPARNSSVNQSVVIVAGPSTTKACLMHRHSGRWKLGKNIPA